MSDGAATAQKLLTNRDAMQQLGVSDGTLRALRKRGLLPFRKIGAQVRYTQADLDEFIERSRNPVD